MEAPKVAPLVSIGMPLYNAERYLRLALDSLLAQDYQNFELIISDNASSDGTEKICREYAERDQRIRYLRLETHVDYTTNFNRLPELAAGKYFMWAANDDLWEPSFISQLVDALERDPEAVLAFSRFETIDTEGNLVQRFKEDWKRIFQLPKFWQFALLAMLDDRTHKATHIYGLIHKDALLACGGMKALQVEYSGSDIVTLLCLLARGNFVVVDQLLFHYRVRSIVTRADEPILNYVWKRVFRQSSGHKGNLFLVLLRNHVYHSSLRTAVICEAPLYWIQKALLYLALTLRGSLATDCACAFTCAPRVEGFEEVVPGGSLILLLDHQESKHRDNSVALTHEKTCECYVGVK